jgi:hypothetical protein
MKLAEPSARSSSVGALAQTNAPIQLANAWSATTSGQTPPIVAVIDTGVDYNHEIFRTPVRSGPIQERLQGTELMTTATVMSTMFMAGISLLIRTTQWMTTITELTSRESFLVPLKTFWLTQWSQQKFRIMALKFLDANGVGTTSDAVKCIYYAVNNGARVLNNSWGGGGFSNSLVDAVAFAYSRRVVFVAAAGNSSLNNDFSPTYPASYSVPGVISVAATTDADGLRFLFKLWCLNSSHGFAWKWNLEQFAKSNLRSIIGNFDGDAICFGSRSVDAS